MSRLFQDLLKKTAVKYAGGAPIYSSTSYSLFEEFSITSKEPVVVSVKDHVREPAAFFFLAGVIESDISAHSHDLDRFLLTHRFPSAFELSSSNFQEVMRGSTADVVVIAPIIKTSVSTPKEVELTLANARKSWISRLTKPNGESLPALFVWMDIGRWEEWLGSMYGFKKSSDTRVVLADHKVSVLLLASERIVTFDPFSVSFIMMVPTVCPSDYPKRTSSTLLKLMPTEPL